MKLRKILNPALELVSTDLIRKIFEKAEIMRELAVKIEILAEMWKMLLMEILIVSEKKCIRKSNYFVKDSPVGLVFLFTS